MKTDKELMQQALDALKLIDEAMPFPVAKLTIKNLSDRLAQPEHDDPIGDAQEKLIAEQASQPQVQPCAGRNCGSTNPNLHSAECFEDYEKTTGMNQWHGLTEEEIDNSYMFWVVDQHDVIGFGKSLETKLKRKNA